MSIVQVEKRGTIVSVTFSLQTPRDAAAFPDLVVTQLKAGELHLRLDSKPRDRLRALYLIN
jgi:hypothetical protein